VRADVETDRSVHPFKCIGVDSALLKFVVNPQHFAAASHHAEISEASFAQSRFQRIAVKLIAAINQNNCISRLPVSLRNKFESRYGGNLEIGRLKIFHEVGAVFDDSDSQPAGSGCLCDRLGAVPSADEINRLRGPLWFNQDSKFTATDRSERVWMSFAK